MNLEKKQQLLILVKLIAIVTCAFLYAWGGMEFKWLRRFLAPAIATATIVSFTRDWRSLLVYPFMCLGLTVGYGGSTLTEKILMRTMFGVVNGITSNMWNVWKKRWLLIVYQLVLVTGSYVIVGVWNPLNSARIEETLLGLIIFTIPILSAQKS